jgi:hypothetical protein
VAQHRAQRVFVLDEQDGEIGRNARARAHRSQPGGTPARRASSSKSVMAFLPATISFFSRSSSPSAFSRSRSMTERWAGSSRLTKSVVSALTRDCSASAYVSLRETASRRDFPLAAQYA